MTIFTPVPREIDFVGAEKTWAEFWREHQIFDRQLAQGKIRAAAEHPQNPTYIFYEGPPTANGIPHPRHVLTRVIKDLFPRFYAMNGYDVPRKAGWDTHGLPVEVEVEKVLKIEGKPGIEKFGVEPFIKKCKDSVFKYSDLWAKLTERIGFWIDLDDPYVTYHQSYINSVWWSLKQIWDAGLIYHGHKIVPWCPRCGTALSSQEVGQGYKTVQDPSAFVAFKSTDDPQTLFVAWTTTPWTLPSNVALAVGADFEYVYCKLEGGETLVVAAALREKTLGKIPHAVVKTVRGADLLGKTYAPLFDFAAPTKPAYRIIAGDFVGLDTGSGIVHIAPAYGEDDAKVGKVNDLPVVNLVDTAGRFIAAATPYAGKFVKDADKEILRDLKARGQLLKTEQYEHEYPFCWRCDSPLLYYPRPAWYIATTKIKDEMLANNEKIGWLPEHIKDGRFGNFLQTNVDWALSRERYWGTPLPIWQCRIEEGGCGHEIIVGGGAELKNLATPESLAEIAKTDGYKNGEIELHKPYVDLIKIKCEKCGAEMARVPEVIDCWYDSGSMPFAQWGYPYADGSAEKLAAAFPADFITEAIDQTRGWFYTLLAIATLLRQSANVQKAAGKLSPELAPWLDRDYPLPYKKCLVLGHVCDEKGFKMSKSKGNYLDPWTILDNEGADALRWYFYSSNQPWTSVRFFQNAIRDAQKDFLIRLRNVYSFFVIYANIDEFNPADGIKDRVENLEPSSFADAKTYVPLAERPPLDLWMLSHLEKAAGVVTENLQAMNILNAAQALTALVDGLSNWFVRRSRDRFWQSEKNAEKWAAYWTLYETLAKISGLIAPFVPYLAEEIYQRLFRDLFPHLPDSIHLTAWQNADAARRNPEVETEMDAARNVVSLGLSARAAHKLKVRTPLSRAVIILSDEKLSERIARFAAVIRDELNVKKLEFSRDAAQYVNYEVKPDFKKLGAKLGAKMKAVAGAIAKIAPAAIIAALDRDGSFAFEVEGEKIPLTTEELTVRLTAKDGFAAQSGGGAVVAIDEKVTPELLREGWARELVNRVQNLRKDLDLAYQQRIALTVQAAAELSAAFADHRDYIMSETLATAWTDAAVTAAGDAVREFEIDGQAVKIAVSARGK
ncbi:isoleucine--tRNA ligase [Planctomycetales bacterium]|nr:isoleucine--tRNA ligase [Planctomycetales bacterium]